MERLLKGRPDSDRENPRYVSEMVEVLSWLTPEEHGWLTHPRDGLHTTCKFLPTPADVHEFIRARTARKEQFRGFPRLHKNFQFDETEDIDVERRKRIVREALGYNPANRGTPEKRTLTQPSVEEVRNLKLQTPPASPSPHLIALLEQQGWPFIPSRKDDDA